MVMHDATEKKSKQICVRVRPILYAKLRRYAVQHHRTSSWVASALLEECMGLAELEETKTRLSVKAAALEPSAIPLSGHHVKRVHGLQIIRASDFVRYGADGNFDYPASKLALKQLAHASHKRGITHLLLDLRDVQVGPKPHFSPDEVVAVIRDFRQIGFTKKDWLAVLYITDPHRNVRLFASVGKLRGWHIAAFDNYEEASHWLGNGTNKIHEAGT